MPSIIKEIKITSKCGVHARPAALLVQIANKYKSDVVLTKDGQDVNGRSIMAILMLGAENGSIITIKADGDDAQELIDEMVEFLENDE